MKAVLMSIHHKWCELIFNGEKTIEVRKTRPLIDMPFKVYVYCTKERMTRVPSMYAYLHKNEPRACAEYGTIETWGEIGDVIVNPHLASQHVSFGMHGKVIGEFVCDRVRLCIPFGLKGHLLSQEVYREMCLTKEQLDKYGGLKTLYGWHITEPKLFDKPKELYEFSRFGFKDAGGCCINYKCPNYIDNGWVQPPECKIDGCFLTCAPQSWCYLEEQE